MGCCTSAPQHKRFVSQVSNQADRILAIKSRADHLEEQMKALTTSAERTEIEGFQEQVEEHLERLGMRQEELESKISSYKEPEASRVVTPLRRVEDLMMFPPPADPAITEMIEKMRREMESKSKKRS